jgi:GT2 family glycosyltransferase
MALHGTAAGWDRPSPPTEAVSKVSLARLEEPLLSVVMVLYGGWELALEAIAGLVERTEPCFELIIVDNASPDDSLARLEAQVDGAEIIRNKTNVGFGAASNQGAERSRGRFLCLLNSDAIVEPGWLPPLMETLAEPEVGVVVPRFLNEDGSLQEAGSVVDSIGHCHAVGAGADPRDFQYRFRRYVDYGSAACIVLPTAVFHAADGFDERFSPGYFEDTDLSFRLRERGLHTVYEPRSQVVHVRHGSGTSESARMTMERNRSVFFERWAEPLARRPRVLEAAQHPHQMLAARDAEALDRFLVIDDRVPHVDRGSGDPRMGALLREIASLWPGARTTFLAESGRDADRYAEPLLRAGVEVVSPPTNWERWFVQRRFHYGVVLVSRQQNAVRFDGYLNRTQPQALRIFDTEALTFLRLERLAELLPPGSERTAARAEAVQTRAAEIRAIQEADVVMVVSEDEDAFVSEVAPGKPTFVLPGIVDVVPDPPGFEERRDLLFFGGFLAGTRSPNLDSLTYLVRDVLPRFWEQHPDVQLHVVGADMDDNVRALAGPRVHIVGYVDDPTEWLASTRLHVNPMRFGAGLKQKFLDSLGAGLPFVTTSVGAEGFPLGDAHPLLVANDARGLAGAVVKLYTDRAAWELAQARLLELGRTTFGPAAFRATLVDALTHVGVAPPRTVAAA